MNKTWISVAVRDRARIAELCLRQLNACKGEGSFLKIYNDGSTEDMSFLGEIADEVETSPQPLGIEAQRVRHFHDYWENGAAFDFFYLTDADAFHDPGWLARARELHGVFRLPVCLYNAAAHVWHRVQEIPEYDAEVRRYAPGISVFLDREMVGKVMERIHQMRNWDWNVPDFLGNRMLTSRRSYVEHYGAGGLHSEDFETDRAQFPTVFLQETREACLKEFLN